MTLNQLEQAVRTIRTVNPNITEEDALKNIIGSGGSMQPFNPGDLVVVIRKGQMVNGHIVGRDFEPLEGVFREGHFVVQITHAISSFDLIECVVRPLDQIWKDDSHGRMACQMKVRSSLQEQNRTDKTKAEHRKELKAGMPYTAQQINLMPMKDRVSLLSILGLNPFKVKGRDRTGAILQAQRDQGMKDPEKKVKLILKRTKK